MSKIFYFSGTGNSLFIARQLAKQMGDCPVVPMVGEVRKGTNTALSGVIGLVFPVHAFSMPKLVADFLASSTFDKNTYIFAVATRMGSSCQVFDDIDKILSGKGVALTARWFINMPNNYLNLLPLSNVDQIRALNIEAAEAVTSIAANVNERKIYEEADPHYSHFERNIMFPMLNKLYTVTNYFGLENKFCADDKCINCSVCSRICPSNKIEMQNEKPVWKKDTPCYHCFACIHYCPAAAIQLNRKTRKVGRYHHANITIDDIAGQKNERG